jgi:hypothetical protein
VASGTTALESSVCQSLPNTKDSDHCVHHSSESIFCLDGNVSDCIAPKQTLADATDSKFQGSSVVSNAEMSTVRPIYDVSPCEASVILNADRQITSDCDDMLHACYQPATNETVPSNCTVAKSVHESVTSVKDSLETSATTSMAPGYSDEPESEPRCMVAHMDKTELMSVGAVPCSLKSELPVSIESSSGCNIDGTPSCKDVLGYVEFVETPLTEVDCVNTIRFPASEGHGRQEQVTKVSVLDSFFATADNTNTDTTKLRTTDFVAKTANLIVNSVQSSDVTPVQTNDQLSDCDVMQLPDPHASFPSDDHCCLGSVELQSHKVKSFIYLFWAVRLLLLQFVSTLKNFVFIVFVSDYLC